MVCIFFNNGTAFDIEKLSYSIIRNRQTFYHEKIL